MQRRREGIQRKLVQVERPARFLNPADLVLPTLNMNPALSLSEVKGECRGEETRIGPPQTTLRLTLCDVAMGLTLCDVAMGLTLCVVV